MNKKIAVCGIDCTICPAYIATQANDDKAKIETAKTWSEMYNADIKPEHINCDGCVPGDGALFNHCHVCEVRKCGFEKNLKNCAYCDEYSCEKLENFFGMAPEAKAMLDEIRKLI